MKKMEERKKERWKKREERKKEEEHARKKEEKGKQGRRTAKPSFHASRNGNGETHTERERRPPAESS